MDLITLCKCARMWSHTFFVSGGWGWSLCHVQVWSRQGCCQKLNLFQPFGQNLTEIHSCQVKKHRYFVTLFKLKCWASVLHWKKNNSADFLLPLLTFSDTYLYFLLYTFYIKRVIRQVFYSLHMCSWCYSVLIKLSDILANLD